MLVSHICMLSALASVGRVSGGSVPRTQEGCMECPVLPGGPGEGMQTVLLQ